MTDRMVQVLGVLARSDRPLTCNEIGMKLGFRTGSDHYSRNGRMLGPGQRVISPIRALEGRGLVRLALRSDGLSGTAYAATPRGREVAPP